VFADSALLDLIHRVQLEEGHADVSLAAVFSSATRVRAGPVTVRELASLYVYDNTLIVIQATGAQLKRALEHSAEFLLPYAPGKTLNQLVNPNMWLYNFDQAEGVSYEIDIGRPVGERIRNLAFQGKPVEPGQVLKLALNNYRFAGGGGYDMFQGCPVLFRSSITLRDMVIAWVERHHAIPSTAVGNWRIVAPGPLDTQVGFGSQDSE
jgi:2',3'-cyclic-nucleotide 2'-phosphodiesterase/3'-nucleotidase